MKYNLMDKKMSDKIELSADVLKIAKIAKALSHPVRVHIIKKLSSLDACCYSGDLVEELPIGRSTLSQHLKELKMAGLIQGEITAPFIKYCINRENWEEAKVVLCDLLKTEMKTGSFSKIKGESILFK